MKQYYGHVPSYMRT